MKSIVSPSFLKQKARQLKKEKSLSQNQALNEAAKELGYSNYKHYLNMLETGRNHKELHLKNISSEKDMSKKMELAILFIQSFKITFHEKLDILKLFQHSDVIQVLCEKLDFMKNDIQSCLLNDFLTDEGKDEIHFRHPYFKADEISLSSLTYEIDEDLLYVDGSYNLKTKIDFGYVELANEEDHENECFNDRELFGTFGIKIDRNKKITIEHSDIGEEIEGSFSLASFR